MPSDLDDAIAAARATIDQEESPIRRMLRDAYDRAIEQMTADLERVTRLISEARRAGVEVNPDWLRRQARYRQLIRQAEAQFARFTDDGIRILRQGRAAAVRGGAIEANLMLDAAGVTTGFESNINRQAVERTAAALSDGPVRETLDGYGRNAAKVIEETLLTGIIEGTGPREIVRLIRRQLRSGLTRARLDALVRTEMMRAFEASLFDQYAAMGLERWRWVAAKSIRTCLACLAMDGRVFSMREPFMRRHVSCRCIPSPFVVEIPYTTGAEWFARQSADRQRLMMPSAESYAAFARGDVTLRDFVGIKRSRKWGSSVYERSGRDALARAT